VLKQAVPSLDFTSAKKFFNGFGFKVQTRDNKLTLEFADEEQLKELLRYLSN